MEAPAGENLVFGSCQSGLIFVLCQVRKAFSATELHMHINFPIVLECFVFVVLHLTSNLDRICGVWVNCDS